MEVRVDLGVGWRELLVMVARGVRGRGARRRGVGVGFVGGLGRFGGLLPLGFLGVGVDVEPGGRERKKKKKKKRGLAEYCRRAGLTGGKTAIFFLRLPFLVLLAPSRYPSLGHLWRGRARGRLEVGHHVCLWMRPLKNCREGGSAWF